MAFQELMDYATTQTAGHALAVMVYRYGKDGREYSTTFDDAGKWCITVRTDDGKVIARFAQD
jgi:hypothetical protein